MSLSLGGRSGHFVGGTGQIPNVSASILKLLGEDLYNSVFKISAVNSAETSFCNNIQTREKNNRPCRVFLGYPVTRQPLVPPGSTSHGVESAYACVAWTSLADASAHSLPAGRVIRGGLRLLPELHFPPLEQVHAYQRRPAVSSVTAPGRIPSVISSYWFHLHLGQLSYSNKNFFQCTNYRISDKHEAT